MRLISLSCDQQSFKTLYFKPTGITFILGNSAYSKESTRVDSSANGVGKTLALGLIHHCLGANVDKTLATVIPDWIFTLEFEHKDKIFKVSRSGDGKKITINGEFYKPTKFIEWLDTHDFFSINGKEIKGLTFRSLYKRFARYKREDCLDPIQLYKESDYEALLRTSFLLGLDISLILNKKQNKADLDKINHYIKNWENDPILKDMITTGTQPKLRCTWLNREISKLENDLQEFQIAEMNRTGFVGESIF
ncbi:hypothetical protein [Acinetobacter variabilis]|uniref:DUF2326 domain-containing protein n=1 Tax=Acinetobacter variabilis TaxID=70346 RepID=N9MRA6_9GAMM|nr:hypothetical protein [Acinetobacter variabilis]ENX11104.1 hypothetical protein F897_00560 [Acinetobacter variabilis]UBI29762.1 hypothetical protein LA331_10800 [Acinetobacter variabilis]